MNTMAHTTELVPAIPLREVLADADARTTRPALAGTAALIPADSPAPSTETLPAVLLEEAVLDRGILAVFKEYPGRGVIRAAFDPGQCDAATAESLLRGELAHRRGGVPVGMVVGVGGPLVLAPLPEGEPARVEATGDGGTRLIVDTWQVSLDEVLEVCRQVRAERTAVAREGVPA